MKDIREFYADDATLASEHPELVILAAGESTCGDEENMIQPDGLRDQQAKEKANEFNPFSREHIGEALRNLPEVDMTVLSAFIQTADTCKYNEYAERQCTWTLLKMIRDYWGNCAALSIKEAQ